MAETTTAVAGEQRDRALNAAIAYADLGWTILPIWPIVDGRCACGCAGKSAGKHPYGPCAPRGLKNATTDGTVISKWFEGNIVPNLAVCCGEESGIMVLDVDPRNGGDESLAKLGKLPDTAIVATGGDGKHFYFRQACPISSGAHRLGPGLDIKATGGYVLIPPSNHISGGTYKWLRDPRAGIAELPRNLLNQLIKSKALRGIRQVKTDSSSADTIRKCLPMLSDRRRENYDDWLAVGMICYHCGLKLEEWDEWSKVSAKYEPDACEKKWASFDTDRDDALTAGSLVYWASVDQGKPVVELFKELGISRSSPPSPIMEAQIVRVPRSEMKRVRWLVRDHFPLGKLSIIAGLPGTTKSLFSIYLIAAMCGKVTLPDMDHYVKATVIPGDALLITCEDDPEDTIAPRLAVYGVDPETVPIIRGTKIIEDETEVIALFDLNRHLDIVEDYLASNSNTRLLVLDPIQTFLGKTELNGNAEVNHALTRLTTLGQRHHVAVLLVMHHNKKLEGSAMDRVIGSRGFSGTARAMWTVAQDPDNRDRHILACVKMQNARRPLAMAHVTRTRPVEIEGEDVLIPYLEFEENRIDVDADDLVQPTPPKKQNRVDQCGDWLETTLNQWTGPMELRLLRSRAKEQGFSNDTFHRAKRNLDPIEVTLKTTGKAWAKYVALRPEDFAGPEWEKVRQEVETGGAK
jgi:hypothetical protein